MKFVRQAHGADRNSVNLAGLSHELAGITQKFARKGHSFDRVVLGVARVRHDLASFHSIPA